MDLDYLIFCESMMRSCYINNNVVNAQKLMIRGNQIMDENTRNEILKYKKFDYGTLRIHRRIIKVKEIDAEEWMGQTQDFMSCFLKQMKTVDPVLVSICQKLTLAGSVSDKLRLADSKEIDFQVRLALPQNFALDIQEDRFRPGFFSLKLSSHPKKKESPSKKCILNWLDANGYILQNEVSSWMQSIVAKTLTALKLPGNRFPYEIEESASGPAKTLSVYQKSTGRFLFDIDIVPVLIYKHRIFVPKPDKENPTHNSLFIESFCEKEKELMFDRQYLKPAIRLMKKFRDSYPELKNFKSYFIKTAFLWELQKHPNIWEGHGITGLFVHMLKVILNKYLIPESLPCLWTRRNLLEKTVGMDNMRSVFKTVINKIEMEFPNKPEIIGEVILSDEQELRDFKSMLL